jgi:hypothetical protein
MSLVHLDIPFLILHRSPGESCSFFNRCDICGRSLTFLWYAGLILAISSQRSIQSLSLLLLVTYTSYTLLRSVTSNHYSGIVSTISNQWIFRLLPEYEVNVNLT